MITIIDCIALSDLSPDEIDAIAEHEHMPFMLALEKGACFLREAWGPAAIRQMIIDDAWRAERCGRPDHAETLQAVYRASCRRLPDGSDRRGPARAALSRARTQPEMGLPAA